MSSKAFEILTLFLNVIVRLSKSNPILICHSFLVPPKPTVRPTGTPTGKDIETAPYERLLLEYSFNQQNIIYIILYSVPLKERIRLISRTLHI